MSRFLATARLLLITLGITLLSGCFTLTIRAAFNPVDGPLAARQPVPAYTARVSLRAPSSITVSLQGDGEVFTGSGRQTRASGAASAPSSGMSRAGLSGSDLSRDWDFVYGAGYYRAHVLGASEHSLIPLTGSKGSTAVLELCNETQRSGDTRGIARDSHGNVYKVTLY